MGTPKKSGGQWTKAEADVLDQLIQERSELEEKDPATEPLDRNETFAWLSAELPKYGYNRSAAAIERKCAGRLRFQSSSSKQIPRSLPNGASTAQPTNGLSSRSSREIASSSEDVPLSHLSSNVRAGSTVATSNSPSAIPTERKRKREAETLDSIIVEPQVSTTTLQAQVPSTSEPNPNAAWSSDVRCNPPPRLSSPFTPTQINQLNMDDDQFKIYAQRKAEALRTKNKELRKEKESQISARSQRTTNLHRLQEEEQSLQTEVDELAKRMKELEERRTVIRDQYTQVEGSGKDSEAVIKEIDEKIKKNEDGVKLFTGVASFELLG